MVVSNQRGTKPTKVQKIAHSRKDKPPMHITDEPPMIHGTHMV